MPPNKMVKLGRNPSYRDSLKAAVVCGVWWAPSSFVETVKEPAQKAAAAVGMAAIGCVGVLLTLGMWIVARLVVIGAGLTGFATEDALDLETDDNQG